MNRRAGRLWRAGEDPGAALAGVRADARWPPRVLHIGNIGNNAYQNARILNSAGVPSDVLCYDYYHIMGCPEWEDADIPEVPAGFDENYPDWSKVALGGFVRPPWFAQGPLPLAALYLGRMAAQVKTTEVNHSQVVELITAGRSGTIGLPPEKPANGFTPEPVVDITPGGDQ